MEPEFSSPGMPGNQSSPTSDFQPEPPSLEANRIRAEFQRRSEVITPDRYSWSHRGNRFQYTRLWSECIDVIAATSGFPLNGKRALDIGCGNGSWLLEFAQWGVSPEDLAGIDLIEERAGSAARALPSADIRVGDASQLPWPDQHFDLVTQFTVFTSILDNQMRRAVAQDMVRVLKPNGLILWYDFAVDNVANPNVRGIPSREIGALFPDCELKVRRLTLAPPLARAVARQSWFLADLLEQLPFLRTHRMAAITKRGQP